MASNLRVDSIVPSSGANVSIGTATGGVNIPGVLTYEDVTNVDSVGVITARSGVKVTGGDILLTGADGRKISFAGDGSSHYFKMDNSFNGPVINGYGGIKFETAGTNERLRITSTGRVSIGNNTSPDGNLHVYNSSAGSVVADTSANLAVFESGNTNNGITILSPNTGKSNIYFGTTGTGGSYEAGIRYTHEQHGTTADRRAMHFRVGGGERARIQSGKLIVGRTNSITFSGDPTDHCFEQLTNNGYLMGLHADQAEQRGLAIYFTPGKSANPFIGARVGTSWKYILRGDGDCENANNSYGSISDVSLKENIVDANSQWNDIKNIKVRNYNYKAETGQQTHKQIGVIAQELETVSPKLVRESEGGMKTVSYSILYMKAIKALQEAQARIETLESKVAALEGS